MIFRDAKLKDLPEIVEIYNSTIPGGMVTADTKPVSVESRLAWFNVHNPEKRPLWIVENEEQKTIGWVSFQSFYGRPAYDATAEISIYLKESERNKGFGTHILNHAIEKGKQIGIKTVLGFVFGHNEPSKKLVKKFGFEQWGFFPKVAVIDSIERDLVIMGKRIG